MSESNTVGSSSDSRRSFTVCVEGNVGCGKSTFLEYSARDVRIEALFEPVSEWTDVAGVNLLEKHYAEPSIWGMDFQIYVNLTMLKGHLKPIGAPVKVMERSLHSARYCFVESLLSSGVLNLCRYSILQEWYDFMNEQHALKPYMFGEPYY